MQRLSGAKRVNSQPRLTDPTLATLVGASLVGVPKTHDLQMEPTNPTDPHKTRDQREPFA